MFFRKYWIPLSVFIVAVVGVGLYFLQTRPPKDPILIVKPVEFEKQRAKVPVGDTSQGERFHADGTTAAVFTPLAFADGVNPTSTSSNPLFADGVPEHLQCPPDLIGVYEREVSKQRIQELRRIGAEILEEWNPNRPLTEVWPAFMDASKWYNANADPEHAGIGWGAKRMDWQFQIVLDFPEIGVLSQEDTSRSFKMWRVELGHWSPDHNHFRLPDGRLFRLDGDKQYEFTWSTYIEKEDGFTAYNGSYTANKDPNAEVVKINLDEVSDEELERLSGWDYTINPYTTGAYKLGDQK